MVRNRGYGADANTVESDERMGPYVGQDNNLVVLLARNFVNKHPFGVSTNILTKSDISNFTLEYYQSVQEDIVEFAIILVIPSNILDTSIFEDDISPHGIMVFNEKELMFNPTFNLLVPKHYLASNSELEEMKEKGITYGDLPKISSKDCMCKWYGFKKDNTIRIERDYCSEVYYRIVV